MQHIAGNLSPSELSRSVGQWLVHLLDAVLSSSTPQPNVVQRMIESERIKRGTGDPFDPPTHRGTSLSLSTLCAGCGLPGTEGDADLGMETHCARFELP